MLKEKTRPRRALQNRALKKLLGLQVDKIIAGWRKLCNEEPEI
jgi:hypothetical protein